ncbi:CTP--phosphocholine cytidylyltransferase, partial [Rodentibacter caecimuris]
ILAAGLGSRFNEITLRTHKALLPINGTPNIEITIKYLIESGIEEIYIVTGHLSSQFNYLKEKYNCNLIYNKFYKTYNNMYSFYLAKEYFGNSFVIDSDVVLFKNIFLNKPYSSFYYLITRPDSNKLEWIPTIENNKISKILVSNDKKPSLLGISYWTKIDAKKIKESLDRTISHNLLLDDSLYWDNIPIGLLDILNVEYKNLSIDDAYEIDNVEEYKFALKIGTKGIII